MEQRVDDAQAQDGRAGPAALLTDVVAGFARLVRGELQLLRAEAVQNLRSAGAGVIKLALAAILGLVGLNVLAAAAVAALSATALGPVWAGVLVAAVVLFAALGLALAGRSALRPSELWPDRTVRSLRRDGEALRAGLTESQSDTGASNAPDKGGA